MDHWNVFMMEREENELGKMGPSSLVGEGSNNLGGVRALAQQFRWSRT
jgi:hypothetical protein